MIAAIVVRGFATARSAGEHDEVRVGSRFVADALIGNDERGADPQSLFDEPLCLFGKLELLKRTCRGLRRTLGPRRRGRDRSLLPTGLCAFARPRLCGRSKRYGEPAQAFRASF